MDVPLTILLMMVCEFTTYIKGSNFLNLTSSPATASQEQPYTLMCSSRGNRDIAWYRRNDIIFRTRYVSDTLCPVDVANNYNYRDLSGRVNVTCSHNQHNVTLRILTSTDNGSVWWCVIEAKTQKSNRLTIHVVNAEVSTAASSPVTSMTRTTSHGASPSSESRTSVSKDVVNLTTMPSTTKTAATTITTEATTTTTATTANAAKSDTSSSNSPQGGDNHVVYIAAGAGVCVAVVIVVVVSVLCIRRRRGRNVNNDSAHEHNHEASHTYYNESLVLQDQDINDKVQVENDIYETSRDVTSSNQPSTNDHMITDVYAQVQKPKKNTPKPTGTADDINMEDLYAKPDKTKIRKKQED